MTILTDGRAEGNILMVNSAKTIRELVDVAAYHKVSLAGGVCIWLQFLPEDAGAHTLSLFCGNAFNLFLRNGQDAARAACAIIDSIGVVCNLVFDRLDSQLPQQTNIVTRCEVFTGFGHVVFLVELTEQFLEDGSHGVVVEAWQTFYHFLCAIFFCHFLHNRLNGEVDVLICELLKKRAKATCLSKVIHLLTELELINDVLNILRKPIEILNDIHLQTLWVYLVLQGLHCESRSIVERIACHLSEKRRIVNEVMAVAKLLLLEHGSLGRFKEHVDTTKHHERQDNLLVVALLKSMHQNIVGNVPNEREKSVILFVVHRVSRCAKLFL